MSSFVEAGGEEHEQQDVQVNQEIPDDQAEERGMAEAFHISSRTSMAVSISIAFAALTLPYFMKSLGQGLALKTKFLSYASTQPYCLGSKWLGISGPMMWQFKCHGDFCGLGSVESPAGRVDRLRVEVLGGVSNGDSSYEYNAEKDSGGQCVSGQRYSSFCWFAFFSCFCWYLVAGKFSSLQHLARF